MVKVFLYKAVAFVSCFGTLGGSAGNGCLILVNMGRSYFPCNCQLPGTLILSQSEMLYAALKKLSGTNSGVLHHLNFHVPFNSLKKGDFDLSKLRADETPG